MANRVTEQLGNGFVRNLLLMVIGGLMIVAITAAFTLTGRLATLEAKVDAMKEALEHRLTAVERHVEKSAIP